MIVAILYGRSWQGVSDATALLGNAAFATKMQVQEAVDAGEKSRPVVGIVKIDKNPVESRQPEPSDYLLLFDAKLVDALKHAKEKSVVIFNSRERISSQLLKKKQLKSFFVDATGIAISGALKTVPHAAMLGAFAKAAGKIPARHIKSQLRPADAAAFEEGFRNVKRN